MWGTDTTVIEEGKFPVIGSESFHSEPTKLFMVSELDKYPLTPSLDYAGRGEREEEKCRIIRSESNHSEPMEVFLVGVLSRDIILTLGAEMTEEREEWNPASRAQHHRCKKSRWEGPYRSSRVVTTSIFTIAIPLMVITRLLVYNTYYASSLGLHTVQ